MEDQPPPYSSPNLVPTAPVIIEQPGAKIKTEDIGSSPQEDGGRTRQQTQAYYYSEDRDTAPRAMRYGPTAPAVIYNISYEIYGPRPQRTICPYCRMDITTLVDYEIGMKTHLCALICCLIGCIPCAILPYCMPQFQSIHHYCPACGAHLGQYG